MRAAGISLGLLGLAGCHAILPLGAPGSKDSYSDASGEVTLELLSKHAVLLNEPYLAEVRFALADGTGVELTGDRVSNVQVRTCKVVRSGNKLSLGNITQFVGGSIKSSSVIATSLGADRYLVLQSFLDSKKQHDCRLFVDGKLVRSFRSSASGDITPMGKLTLEAKSLTGASEAYIDSVRFFAVEP